MALISSPFSAEAEKGREETDAKEPTVSAKLQQLSSKSHLKVISIEGEKLCR